MFVTLEGPEGAGKSTAIRRVAELLREGGIEVLCTREPGSGEFGAAIRSLLLQGDALSAEAELFLFLADRAEHVRRVIRPALAQGIVVLCDRFADSTTAYQAHGRGLSLAFVRSANRVATGDLQPDLTFLLDLEPRVGLGRLSEPDRLDREPLEFHDRLRKGFLQEAQGNPDRWRVLDANAAPESLAAEIADIILGLVPKDRPRYGVQ